MEDISRPTHNTSFSFNIRPNVHFETQHDNEEVILIVRKHPLTQLPWIFNTVFLIIVGIILGSFLLPQIMPPQYVVVYFLFLAFFIFSYVWLNFLLWYFTIGIVSNERIIDLDFLNILYKEFTATTIDQVSDITTKVGGFFGSFFNFGDVHVKTEGFQQNIEFLDVPQPADIMQVINILMKNKDTPN